MKFIHSIFNDLKSNKIFTLIIVFEILALILIGGVFMQNANVFNAKAYGYNAEYENATVLKIDNFKDKIDLEGFENIACSVKKSTSEQRISVINPLLSKIFKTSHKGEWFSGETNENNAEALVSGSLKKTYKIGETYTVDIGAGESKTIKVIGYLGKENMGIYLAHAQFSDFFNPFDIMICDNISREEILNDKSFGENILIAMDKDKQFYIDEYNASAQSLGEAYELFATYKYVEIYHNNFIVCLILGLIIIGIMCNSIYQTEENIRRKTVKYVVGEAPKQIVAAEITKSAMLYAVPFILDLIIVAIINLVSKGSNLPQLITWSGFFIAAITVFAVYCLSIVVGLVRVLKSKPLEELKR